MRFNLLRKRQYLEWDDYKNRVDTLDEFRWRQTVRRTFLS